MDQVLADRASADRASAGQASVDIDKHLGMIFSASLVNVVSTVSGIYLETLPQESGEDIEEMAGVMCLSGKKLGMLFVSAKENDVRLLCSYMTGTALEEVTKEDIEDTLCELVNMTAGNAKLRLSDTDYVFNLSTPFVLVGQNMGLAVKNKIHVISRMVGNGEISLNLKFVY